MKRLLGAVVCVSVGLAAGCTKRDTLPGLAVGDMGARLSAYAYQVPRGAEACAIEEGIKRQAGDEKKCKAERAKDELWGRSLDVLIEYSRSLQAIAKGGDADQSGKLAGELTLIRDENFVEVEGDDDQAARKAAYELVTQMQSREDDAKLAKVVEAAAPHVQTLCDGLLAYLGEQGQRFTALEKDVATKLPVSPGPPRCTSIGGQSHCVNNSTLDYLSYAEFRAHLSGLGAEHEAAHNSVAAFCVAHYTMAQDAASGKLKGKETYDRILGAVHSAIPVDEATPSTETKP